MTFSPSGTAVVGPVSQNTTADFVPVPGTIIDLAQTVAGNAFYTIQETGGVNGINFKVQASLDQLNWFDVLTNSFNSDGSAGAGSGGVSQPIDESDSVVVNGPASPPWPGRYLQICIVDTDSGSHGVALINGFAK